MIDEDGRAVLIRMVVETLDEPTALRWLDAYAKLGARVEGFTPYGGEDDPFGKFDPSPISFRRYARTQTR